MLRRSVRALEVLLGPQPPAKLLLAHGGTAVARNSVAQAARQLWRRPAARGIASATTRATTRPAQSASLFRAARPPPRRAFHASRAQRSQEGPKGGAADKAGAAGDAAAESLTLNQRFKKLSREYGWAAVGVYLGLSLLDFPFCFLLVRTMGTEKIAAAEEAVVSRVASVVPESIKASWRKSRAALKGAQPESGREATEGAATDGWGVQEAEKRRNHEASLATQLALAYAIHKSFIFVRVPLAAAVTPKVVKVLRSWGWKIGKPKQM